MLTLIGVPLVLYAFLSLMFGWRNSLYIMGVFFIVAAVGLVVVAVILSWSQPNYLGAGGGGDFIKWGSLFLLVVGVPWMLLHK